MASLSQANRPLKVKIGSVDEDAAIITAFSGRETLSRLYTYTLEIAAPLDAPLKFDAVLGQAATVTIEQQVGLNRFVHGIINRFSQGGRDRRFVRYRAELVPVLWLLTKQIRTRTFQQMTVGDILKEVLGAAHEVRFNLEGTYFPRNYCVQYRESDFDFACRLMEEEGIHFYFTHTQDGQELVVSDNPRGHDPLPDDPILLFLEGNMVLPSDGRITRWERMQALRAGGIDLTDYTFEMPTNPLQAMAFPLDTARVGTITHQLGVGGTDKLATVDHPGGYARFRDGVAPGGADRADDLQHVFDENGRVSGVRMDLEQVGVLEIEAASNYNRVTAGHKFTLQDHFDADGDYVVTTVAHVSKCGIDANGAPEGFGYENTFSCIPFDIPFRPERKTPKPYIRGTQTAVVVGSPGEEIEPDKYGRVKVQFHWDRQGKHDLDSSCWVRVAQFWAGKQWGAQFIPRIGHEVVVAFVEGDPDQPIIIGSVYNADNMPPYALPDNKTQSGIKSRSSLHGDSQNFNEIKFEDKKGQELVSIHAEKDMSVTVEDNHTLSVGGGKGDPAKNGTSTTTIFGDTKVNIKKGNFSFDVEAGTSTTHVKGDVTENYDAKQTTTVKGDQMNHITGGHHLVKVDTGHASLHVDGGNRFVNVGAGYYDLLAATKITLTVGGSFIQIVDGKITLHSDNIVIEGTTSVSVAGGGADTSWKGSQITENGPSGVAVTGATIKLNS